MNSRGYTLIELALVVLLIGLFSALVVPLLPGVGERNLGASARRLAGTVRYLFNESALQAREHRILFDLDRGSYRTQRLEEDGEVAALDGLGRGRDLPDDIRIRDILIPGRGKFTSGEVTARLHPEGWMDELVIHLADGGGEVLTLRSLPLTGTTEIHEGYREFE